MQLCVTVALMCNYLASVRVVLSVIQAWWASGWGKWALYIADILECGTRRGLYNGGARIRYTCTLHIQNRNEEIVDVFIVHIKRNIWRFRNYLFLSPLIIIFWKQL